MAWTERSAMDSSTVYEVHLYGFGEDGDGDGLVDEASLFFQITTIQEGRPVMREEGIVLVSGVQRTYADVGVGRTIVLENGMLVLDHNDTVELSGGDLWLFEND